jgi:hypothetical protein
MARMPVSVRPATTDDLRFVDSLQKAAHEQIGWMPTKQLEGKIGLGHVLIAEERDEETERRRDEVEGAHSVSSSLRLSVSTPIGYVIGNDQYLKRDDVGFSRPTRLPAAPAAVLPIDRLQPKMPRRGFTFGAGYEARRHLHRVVSAVSH